MEVSMTKLDNGVKLINLVGRLDMEGTGKVDIKFTGYAASEKAGVVVNLSQVDFLASIGIRLLISSAKGLQNRGGKMALLNPVPMVADVLNTAGIGMIIPIYSDLDAACADVLAGMKA